MKKLGNGKWFVMKMKEMEENGKWFVRKMKENEKNKKKIKKDNKTNKLPIKNKIIRFA